MEMKIMWVGAAVLLGWLLSYLFVRQFLFNLLVAKPVINNMRKADKDLIAPGADKYTAVSLGICGFFVVIALVILFAFCSLYIQISFLVGAVIGGVMVAPGMKPENRAMFDSFCLTYFRFVPDDELRTAMYNKKPSQMKLRLHDMGLSTDFIPTFAKEK